MLEVTKQHYLQFFFFFSQTLYGKDTSIKFLLFTICISVKIIMHNLEINTQEATLTSNMVEPACAIYWVCGLAVTAGIAVKFGTTHGRSRLGVGGAKCIGSYGRKGVPQAPWNFGAS